MSDGRYTTWWRQRWVPALFGAGTLGRLPLQMYPLAVLLLVHERTGSYASAGAATAAAAIGYATAAPVQGRLVDRYGQTVPLTATAAVSAGALGLLLAGAVSGAGGPVLVPLAAVAGMALPPVAACQRRLWTAVIEDPAVRKTAFTVDSMVLDLGLIAGPLLVAAIAAATAPALALVVTAVMLVAGTVWFSRLEPSRRAVGEAPSDGPARRRPLGGLSELAGPLRSPGTRTVLTGIALAGLAIGAVRVGCVSVADAHGSPDVGGVLISLFGAGSLTGGLVYGAWGRPGDPARRWVVLLGCYTVGLVLLAAASWSLPVMAVVAVMAGAVLTPEVVTEFELIPRCAPAAAVTEAYAWGITATFVGDGLGSALGGALVGAGARLPLVLAAAGAAAATAVASARRTTLVPVPAPVGG